MSPALLARIEEAGLNASAPPQQRLVDGWLVRFCPGKAKRARCINAIATGRLPLDERLARCADVYRDVGLPMMVRITPFSMPEGLDEALAARGWHSLDDTRVMVLKSLDALARIDHDPEIQPLASEPFAHCVGALRGSPLAQRQAHAHRLVNAPVPFNAWVCKRDGEVLACGQTVIEAGIVGLYDVVTATHRRGEGHAGRLCEHMLSRAAAAGAKAAYLQVEAHNVPARALYRRLGFVDGYAYHYRCADRGAT
jgi:ribosomal protein S18 acetylase RimI-like enzyme